MPLTDALTDEELRGIAAQTFNMAWRDIERGTFNFLMAAYFASLVPPLCRMDKIEKAIIQKLGENWLNSGATKDVGFSVMRFCIDVMPPDAVAFATVANRFKTTPRFDAMPKKAQRKLLGSGADRCHQAVAEGLLTVNDALNVIVQTPLRVCQYIQDYDPATDQPIGQVELAFHAQEDFGGRLKMFGEEKTDLAKSAG